LTPLVHFVMVLLWPIAFPIAKMLDHFLHDEDEESSMNVFNRGERSALVQSQYEEGMAVKQQRKQGMTAFQRISPLTTAEHVGGLDFSASTAMVDAAIRASKRDILRHQSTATTRDSYSMPSLPDGDVITRIVKRSVSVHIDEVAVIEGDLQMKTKMAMDVFASLHRMCSIPFDMVLNERSVVSIYVSGFSRISVFERNPKKPKSCAAIRGILMTKSLIVVNPNEDRPLATLPLYTPLLCVSPKTNLVDLLNIFQTGKKGHLALVCARPMVAEDSLNAGHAVPEAAGFMGYVRGLDGNYFL
jgi:metal transporter CNNM